MWIGVNTNIYGKWLTSSCRDTHRLAHSLCEAHALLSPTQARARCWTMIYGSPTHIDAGSNACNVTSATQSACVFFLPKHNCEQQSTGVKRAESVIQLWSLQGCPCQEKGTTWGFFSAISWCKSGLVKNLTIATLRWDVDEIVWRLLQCSDPLMLWGIQEYILELWKV